MWHPITIVYSLKNWGKSCLLPIANIILLTPKIWLNNTPSIAVEAPIVITILIPGVVNEFATICKGDLLSAIVSAPITPIATTETAA